MRILTVFGTRPEAIKLAPVIKEMQKEPALECLTCVTAQHRGLLDQVLDIFGLKPDMDLDLMRSNQTLEYLTARILEEVGRVLERTKPDWVLVQGDTTTVFAAALSAFYKKVRVAHLEAGLRTDDLFSPWPEEGNRRLVTALSSINFVPTQKSFEALCQENVPREKILLTGNTVIDALLETSHRIDTDFSLRNSLSQTFSKIDPCKKLILVTLHRRESHGLIMAKICEMLKMMSLERQDLQFVVPMHPNPNVQSVIRGIFAGADSCWLLPPQDYLSFVYLLKRAFVVVTDSGGVQEEAPSLNKPVLVVRDKTERMEGVDAGCSLLVGRCPEEIRRQILILIDYPKAYEACININNPYGDGQACKKICLFFKEGTHGVVEKGGGQRPIYNTPCPSARAAP